MRLLGSIGFRRGLGRLWRPMWIVSIVAIALVGLVVSPTPIAIGVAQPLAACSSTTTTGECVYEVTTSASPLHEVDNGLPELRVDMSPASVRAARYRDSDSVAPNNLTDAARRAGNTSVYRSANAVGETQYVGITKNLEQRAAAHLRQKGIIIDEIPGLSGLSRTDARAVEQVLIEFHGLGKNGGTLMNKINSIAKTNPAYGGVLTRGAELLRSVGYPGF